MYKKTNEVKLNEIPEWRKVSEKPILGIVGMKRNVDTICCCCPLSRRKRIGNKQTNGRTHTRTITVVLILVIPTKRAVVEYFYTLCGTRHKILFVCLNCWIAAVFAYRNWNSKCYEWRNIKIKRRNFINFHYTIIMSSNRLSLV